MFKKSNGISLIALIVTIIVIIILAGISMVMNDNALDSMSEARFKAELRGLSDRLKIYHEEASLEMFEYNKKLLSWDGEAERATNTGKVEDTQKEVEEALRKEDTPEYIFEKIPKGFGGIIAIANGELVVREDKISEDQKDWAEDLQIEAK